MVGGAFLGEELILENFWFVFEFFSVYWSGGSHLLAFSRMMVVGNVVGAGQLWSSAGF